MLLDKVAEKFGHKFNYTQLLMGGCSIDANGVPLTDETIAACKASDAVLMGSIGGDKTTSPWSAAGCKSGYCKGTDWIQLQLFREHNTNRYYSDQGICSTKST